MRISIPHFYAWSFWILVLAAAYSPRLSNRSPVKGGDATVFRGGLACNDTIHITLGENCRSLLTPDQLLEGDPGCLKAEDFDISIYDLRPDNGAQLDGYGVFRYEIRRKAGAGCSDIEFTSCWGYIRAEDKSPPRVECPPATDRAGRPWNVQLLAGTLSGANPLIDLTAGAGCQIGNSGVFQYDLRWFEVTKKAVYVMELRVDGATPVGVLYQEDLNPKDPCKRLIAVTRPIADQTGYFPAGITAYRLAVELLPGRRYALFTAVAPGKATDYLWATYTNGSGHIAGTPVVRQPVVQPLYCTNIDSVRQNAASLAYTGKATARDNCDTPESLGFVDRVLPGEDCADRVLERTFAFRDKADNRAACTQRITFHQPGLADVILPPWQAFIHCDENFMADAAGNPAPMAAGRPFLLTAYGPLFLDTVRCGIGATYHDDAVLAQCNDTRLILRTWTVVNWCKNEEKITMTQRILIGDFVGPSFDCPAPAAGGGLTYSTGPFSCFAAFEAPLPANITDNCSPTWSVETQVLLNGAKEFVTLPAGAASRLVTGLPIGRHAFRFIARDGCDNTTIRDCPFQVVDGVAPVAICDDQLNLSVGGEGRGSVTVEEVDEGSWDNCDPKPRLEIRRAVAAECVETYRVEVDTFVTFDKTTGRWYTPWRQKLDFICCDVGRKVLIELRVTDAGGLANRCWQEVLVEDKIAPRCIAPHDLAIPCDSLEYIDERDTAQLQAYFGRAGVEDNCSAVVRELEPKISIGNCGTGTLVRRFEAVDRSGNRSAICEQTIFLTARHNYEIKFPKDIERFSCGQVQADTVQLRAIACDLLALSRDTTYFEAEADECYKMHIRYRVINWCEYKDGQSPVVVGRDEDGDGKPGDEPVYVLRRPYHPDSTYIDKDNQERNGYFRRVTSVGYWEYTQVLKVYDTVPPTIFIPPWESVFCAINSCFATVDLPYEINDNCGGRQGSITLQYDEDDDGDRQDLDVTIYIKGRFPKQRISGEFPIGKHAFYLKVIDGCGNFSIRRIPFEVVDCKPPAPVCIQRLAAELMPLDKNGDGIIDGAANTVWATDFIASDGFDCTGIRYSINRKGARPHPDSVSITVSCSDPDTLAVEIYAWDNATNPFFVQPNGKVGGPNFSKCAAFIYVQDNRFNLCDRPGGASTIAGTVRTEDKRPMPGADVRLSGESSQSFYTSASGSYLFSGIRLGYDYTVSPHLDTDPLNGVTTFDLLTIAKHILGIQRLTSPYKIIAADANRSGSVTTLDLIQLRKLILGADVGFSNNTSWRFIPTAFAFPDPANPWKASFPELININDFGLEPVSHDFVALKVGDVNGNVVVGAFRDVQPRSAAAALTLRTADMDLQAGEEYAVVVSADDPQRVQGFQFTMSWDRASLDFIGLSEGMLREEHLGLFPAEGMLTVSWFSLRPAVAAPLITLRFRATTNGRLRDVLRVDSRRTPAEAYDLDGQLMEVGLKLDEPSAVLNLPPVLYANRPNPFRNQTVIAFRLPADGEATLRVYDVNGRRLYERSALYAAGYHEVDLYGADLGDSGVLYYSLETPQGLITRKMIRLE